MEENLQESLKVMEYYQQVAFIRFVLIERLILMQNAPTFREKLQRAHPLLDDLGVTPFEQMEQDGFLDEPSFVIQPENVEEAANVTPRTARTAILEHLQH